MRGKLYSYILVAVFQTSICLGQTFTKEGKIEITEEQLKELLLNRENWLTSKQNGVLELHIHGASYLDEVFYPFSDRLLNATTKEELKKLLMEWKIFLEDNIEEGRYKVAYSLNDDLSNFRKTVGALHHSEKLIHSINGNEVSVKNVQLYFKSTFTKLVTIANSNDHELIGSALYIMQLLSPAHKDENARWFEENWLKRFAEN